MQLINTVKQISVTSTAFRFPIGGHRQTVQTTILQATDAFLLFPLKKNTDNESNNP
jgi:hypothetical protein